MRRSAERGSRRRSSSGDPFYGLAASQIAVAGMLKDSLVLEIWVGFLGFVGPLDCLIW